MDANVYLHRKHNKKGEFEELLTTIRPIRQHATPPNESAITKAYIDGMPILEIEKCFSISNAMVYRYLKKNKVALRQNKRGVPSLR
jgi:DNA invertase Pin-like site-specific DNA recombinase